MKIDYHIPVLLDECITALAIKPHSLIVDATLGGGSHTRAILESEDTVRVIAFDQDKDAIDHAGTLVDEFKSRLTLIHDNFSNLRSRLALERIKKIDGILFDLGVSSHQIDTASRGFSYMRSGKLDMRMDKRQSLTAEKIVNEYPVDELIRIFRDYGEERESSRIAHGIDKYRQDRRIESTMELSEIIDKSTRSKMKIKARTRIFQALRIYINKELEVLKIALKDAVNILNPGGRIAVISFSSLEDRIVKNYFRYESKSCVCPPELPICVCNKQMRLSLHKSIVPSGKETANVRSRSARLRYATRLDEEE